MKYMSSYIVDSHQHFWLRERGDYGWLTEDLKEIYRDFLPDDLRLHLTKGGVQHTVLVQAAPSLAETEFMLNLAADTDFVAGVVGWVNMDSDSVLNDLQGLISNAYFKGIRPMLQDIDDTDWILNSRHSRVFEFLIHHNLCFDALVTPRHLTNLLTITQRHPDLKAVIDHAAKPEIIAGNYAAWAKDMKALAQESNIMCKLSGILTEAPPNATISDIEPYIEFLLEAFGPERLIWGSDWPVLNLASSYQSWLSMVQGLLKSLSESEQDLIMRANAVGFYNLPLGDNNHDI